MMIINRQQATIIMRLVDLATEGNWPQVAEGMQASGYTPEEVCEAFKLLAEEAGERMPFEVEDFD